MSTNETALFGVDLERLRNLLEKASAGPWSMDRQGYIYAGPHKSRDGHKHETRVAHLSECLSSCDGCTTTGTRLRNGRLIVAVLNALPALLDEIDRLQAVAAPTPPEKES